MADTPIEQKASINTKQTEFFMNIPKAPANFSSNYPSKENNDLVNTVSSIGNLLLDMEERNKKILTTAFDNKVSSLEKDLELSINSATSNEELETIFKNYKSTVDTTAKDMLGTFYKDWQTSDSPKYYDLVNDSVQRAKIPIAQRNGSIAMDSLLENAANARAKATTPEERTKIDEGVKSALNYATFGDTSIHLYNAEQMTYKLKQYNNTADVISLKEDAKIDAKGTLGRMKTGYYKNLTAEQLSDYTPTVTKLFNEQEQENIYNYALNKFTNKKSGVTDYASAASYLNTKVEKDLGVSAENAKAASDMVMAKLVREDQIKTQIERNILEKAYDDAFSLYLQGKSEDAVKFALNSNIPADDKYKLIQNFKDSANIGKIKNSDPKIYSNLSQQIVEEKIYDALPIVKEFALGHITEKDKDDLISLINQVQEPSSTQYKRAMYQVDNAIKSGIWGSSILNIDTKAYIKNKLTQEYRNAVKDGKTLQEIDTMFNPVRVNALISQGITEFPDIKKKMEDTIQVEQSTIAGTERVQESYNNLQKNIIDRKIKTEEELNIEISKIEKDNTYFNTIEVQNNLKDLFFEYSQYDRIPKMKMIEPVNPIILDTATGNAIARQTIGLPVLQLKTIPALPNESIEDYTKRIQGVIL